ncbi:hypothetical protein F5Y16DRAFT_375839, partial [Xylariaceae sp. FL0255]
MSFNDESRSPNNMPRNSENSGTARQFTLPIRPAGTQQGAPMGETHNQSTNNGTTLGNTTRQTRSTTTADTPSTGILVFPIEERGLFTSRSRRPAGSQQRNSLGEFPARRANNGMALIDSLQTEYIFNSNITTTNNNNNNNTNGVASQAERPFSLNIPTRWEAHERARAAEIAAIRVLRRRRAAAGSASRQPPPRQRFQRRPRDWEVYLDWGEIRINNQPNHNWGRDTVEHNQENTPPPRPAYPSIFGPLPTPPPTPVLTPELQQSPPLPAFFRAVEHTNVLGEISQNIVDQPRPQGPQTIIHPDHTSAQGARAALLRHQGMVAVRGPGEQFRLAPPVPEDIVMGDAGLFMALEPEGAEEEDTLMEDAWSVITQADEDIVMEDTPELRMARRRQRRGRVLGRRGL